jgi:cytochrome P450
MVEQSARPSVDGISGAAVGSSPVTVADTDLISDETLFDPFPAYTEIRDAATAVWLEKHRVWAVARYADVQSVLRNHRVFGRRESGYLRATGRIAGIAGKRAVLLREGTR